MKAPTMSGRARRHLQQVQYINHQVIFTYFAKRDYKIALAQGSIINFNTMSILRQPLYVYEREPRNPLIGVDLYDLKIEYN